jgi:type VI secretion system protein ImpK
VSTGSATPEHGGHIDILAPPTPADGGVAGVQPLAGDRALARGPGHASASPLSGQVAVDLPDVVYGANPLLTAANALLNLIPQLRAMPQHPDPDALRDYLIGEVQLFERRARDAGVRPETVIGARYCLCTALDETAAQTPWGGSGAWSRNSLLVTFHNETWGGEKFFQLLSKLAENPQQHIDLLELMNVCLALGFEGRYRVVDNGRAQLETIRERLTRIIRTARGELDPGLSPHWIGETGDGRRRLGWLPLWVVATVAALLLAGIYLWFNFNLESRSDALFSAINAIRLPPIQVAAKPAPSPRLARFLEPEIREGLLTVRDEADRSVIVLRGDGLFESASTAVRPRYLPVIDRVAAALDSVSGNVLVTGYTDSTPIRTARFPSNWQLSQERAEAVAAILDKRLAARGRVRSEGRADADPVAPNDTAENRARNRRVEITLLLAPPDRDRQLNVPGRDRPAASAPGRDAPGAAGTPARTPAPPPGAPRG